MHTNALGRGELGQAVSEITLVAGDGSETRLELEPATEVTCDGSLRFMLAPSDLSCKSLCPGRSSAAEVRRQFPPNRADLRPVILALARPVALR
jgi:hypothetical protein